VQQQYFVGRSADAVDEVMSGGRPLLSGQSLRLGLVIELVLPFAAVKNFRPLRMRHSMTSTNG